MKQNEMGFTFAGKHSRDFGLVWVESKGHPLTPAIERSEYRIGGRSGTVLMPGETRGNMEIPGSLFVVEHEPETQREAQQLARRVTAWLCQGRRELIFDYEPDRYYLAQVDKGTTWNLDNWFGGEIGIRFVAQPWAYNLIPDMATALIRDESMTIPLRVNTLHPAPLAALVRNTGTAIIDRVTLMAGRVDLRGLELAPGDAVTISMEDPIGAQYSDGRSALPCAERFDLIELGEGLQGVPVGIGIDGGGERGAQVTLSARGRW